MDKEFLEQCLADGLSLEAIGKKTEKHESTVSYWLKKYGLVAGRAEKHAAKGGVAKEQLEQLLATGLSLREIAHQLDRSLGTIRHWMKRYELKPNPRRRRGEEDGPRELPSRCRRHGDTSFVREGRGYYRCKRCRNERVSERRRTIKRKLVEEAGGKCVICGYNRCQQVLEFHHLDPTAKEFHLGCNGVTRSLEKSRLEARKCVLLCSNCHGEVEAGIAAVPLNSLPDANPSS
ncbi:MAG TPA: helix-turn-helix domain-containing protein [Solirubrobacterales bacterium]|nr:helix-turn-helix domain-containing protein [Solirubrobacterales bacterium]